MRLFRFGIKGRVVIIGFLAAASLMLVLLNLVQEKKSARQTAYVRKGGSLSDVIDRIVTDVLSDFRIGSSAVKLRQVKVEGASMTRTERTVRVSREFVSIDFNRKMNRALNQIGARAIATERAKDNVVTFHILKDGMIVQSIQVLQE